MRTRRPYAFRGRHLTGIDLAEQVEKQPELRALRGALAQRLGEEAAQEEAETVLRHALDDLGEDLVDEVSRDIDAILRTWSRLADHYRSAGDRAEAGRIALELADLPGRLEERVAMVPNAGGLISQAIPASLVSRLRYPVAAGRVHPDGLVRLGQRLKDALPAAIARDLQRFEALDRLVHQAVQPLLRGLQVLPQTALVDIDPEDAEPTGAGWVGATVEELTRKLSAGPLRFERAWPSEAPPTEDHLPGAVESLAVDPLGRLALWGRWEPWLHPLEEGGAERRLGGLDGRAWWRHCLAAAVAPDGRRAATGGASITVWDLVGERVLLDLAEVETEELHDLAFSPCGRLLAAVGASGAVTVFDAGTGQERWRVQLEDPATTVAFSADGRRLLVGGWSGVLTVHAAEGGARLAAFDDIGGCINDVAIDPAGRWVATAGGCGCASGAPLNPDEVGLRLWDAASGQVVRDLPGHTHPVSHVAIVGDRLVSIAEDRTLRLWALPDGRPLALVDLAEVDDLPTALAASQDGRVLVGTQAGWVAAWRVG